MVLLVRRSFLLQKQAMGFEEIFDASFPNGLHDAEIERVALDYVAREAVFDCSVWVGDMDAAPGEAREAHRRGRLVFTGLLYCVIDPPDASYPYQDRESLWVASDGPVGPNKDPGQHLPKNLPDGAFARWFFIKDWNAFIYVAARKVRFEWADV
jgi:hypothetical protein